MIKSPFSLKRKKRSPFFTRNALAQRILIHRRWTPDQHNFSRERLIHVPQRRRKERRCRIARQIVVRDEVADELLVVTATGETIFAGDFRVGLARVNFRAMQLRQHARHDQPHPGAITRTVRHRHDARSNLLIVDEGMAEILLSALQGRFKQWRTILHEFGRCV